MTRRDVLRRSARAAGALSLASVGNLAAILADEPASGVLLNDAQSQLNPTRVHEVLRPRSVDDLAEALRRAKDTGRAISVAGGRHSMGAQQFGTDNLHLDATSLDGIVSLDVRRGMATVEAGIQWPALIEGLRRRQADDPRYWTIREKQTGVDAVTIGGSLSSNIHGRSLARPPMVDDIESFDIVDASGELKHCSRTENAELFSLAIGGYGLFGLVARVTLRLIRRFKVRRRVEVIAVKDVLEWRRRRIEPGFLFGDCQYATLGESRLGVRRLQSARAAHE